MLLKFGSVLFLLPLILRLVPPEHLGLWYVFLAVGGFAAMLDLGFAPTVMRAVAYLWAGAEKLVPIGIDRSETNPSSGRPNQRELVRLIATFRAYYFWCGLLALVLMTTVGGVWIFRSTSSLPEAASLRAAWFVYATAVYVNFIGDVWGYLLAGIGEVRRSQQNAVFSQLLYYALAGAGLLLGLKLWALIVATLASGLVARLANRIAFLRLVPLPRSSILRSCHWDVVRVLWPNAWRMAVVGLGGYFVSNANTLICSHFLGLKTTAMYGVSVQAAMMLYWLSSVWVNVKLPLINRLRSQHRDFEVAQIFSQRVRLALLTFAAGAAGLWAVGPPLLVKLGAKTNLLAPALLATLLLILLLEMHHALYGSLVLTENRNPFVVPALISGLAVAVLSWYWTPRIGVWGLLLAAGGVQACFNNWWSVVRAIDGLAIGQSVYWRLFFLGSKAIDPKRVETVSAAASRRSGG